VSYNRQLVEDNSQVVFREGTSRRKVIAMHKQGASGSAMSERPENGNTSLAVRGLIYFVLALAIVLVVYSAYSVMQDRASLRASDAQLVARHGLIEPFSKSLASDYRDDNGDLLADHPIKAADQRNPASLIVIWPVRRWSVRVLIRSQATGRPSRSWRVRRACAPPWTTKSLSRLGRSVRSWA
jgi:hypothetical protein